MKWKWVICEKCGKMVCFWLVEKNIMFMVSWFSWNYFVFILLIIKNYLNIKICFFGGLGVVKLYEWGKVEMVEENW